MTDEKNPQPTPGDDAQPAAASGSRWEPDPAAPAAGAGLPPVPPADAAYGAGAPPVTPAARRRPSRTQVLTGGIAAAALVLVGGLGFAAGHATGDGDHDRDGFSDVSFQQGDGDHGLPPGANGVPAPPQPPFGGDDDEDDD